MQFSYKAHDARGQIVEGVMDAEDRFIVARELRKQNYIPFSVVSIGKKKSRKLEAHFLEEFFSGIKLHEKIVFVNNLSGMLSAGLTLYRSLEVELRQTKNPALKTILNGLLVAINQGESLSEGVSKYPAVFSELFVSMIHAGEESGNLPWALKEIGTNLQKSYDLNRKVKGALTYPVIIVCAIIIVGVIMLIFVIPTLTKIFTDMGAVLPPTTQFVINISNALSKHPFISIGSIIAFAGLFIAYIRSPKFRSINDLIILKLPIVGSIVKEVNIARTARTLSSLLASGVDVTRSIAITKDVLQNTHYKAVLEHAGVAVQKGETLASVFKNEESLYPVMIGEMIAVGEETGKLSQMLAEAATFFEDEVDTKTKSLSTIIEPVVMVLVGAAVGFFAISMISPMYSLLGSIQ
ncbi:MAG: type II secretion system F family protein [bacterium]